MTEADQLRENAELTTSNARLREALINTSIRDEVETTATGNCWCQHEPGRHEWWCIKANETLAASPAASLAAIQNEARAEEREACESIAEVNGSHGIAYMIRNRGNGEEAK